MSKGKKSKKPAKPQNQNAASSSSAGPSSSAAIVPVIPEVGTSASAMHPFGTPLPNPASGSANPSASLTALWNYIRPALDHIVRSPTNTPVKAPPIDVAYHMGIHTAVYNYFTSQSESAVPGAMRDMPFGAALSRPDKGKAASGTDLYEKLDGYYADTAREVFLGAPHDDASLVFYLIPCFQRYSSGVQSVNRLLNYVNRHYVKRAIDEDRGWLRLADVFDAVAKIIQEDDTREKIQQKLRERRVEELKKWGYREDGPPELLAQVEAYAEAASPPDRIVPLIGMGYRRFRIECLDPLLVVPKLKKTKKKKIPSQNGGGPQMPRGRLARAVKDLLEGEGGDIEERRRVAGELAIVLRTCGIRVDHPLRKKLDKFAPPSSL